MPGVKTTTARLWRQGKMLAGMQSVEHFPSPARVTGSGKYLQDQSANSLKMFATQLPILEN